MPPSPFLPITAPPPSPPHPPSLARPSPSLLITVPSSLLFDTTPSPFPLPLISRSPMTPLPLIFQPLRHRPFFLLVPASVLSGLRHLFSAPFDQTGSNGGPSFDQTGPNGGVLFGQMMPKEGVPGTEEGRYAGAEKKKGMVPERRRRRGQ